MSSIPSQQKAPIICKECFGEGESFTSVKHGTECSEFKRDGFSYEEYKELFMVQFIATWTANNYEESCMIGNHDKLMNPPFEDAAFIAAATWKSFSEASDE